MQLSDLWYGGATLPCMIVADLRAEAVLFRMYAINVYGIGRSTLDEDFHSGFHHIFSARLATRNWQCHNCPFVPGRK
jgi:hypothetical protein